MKKLLVTIMAGAALHSAPAQLFSSEALGGAMWGSVIGGIVGGDCRHGFSGRGAAIGAGVGLLAGTLAGEGRREHYFAPESGLWTPAPTVSFGYGYGSCGNSAYVYYAPNSYCAPGYYYRPTRANYAVSGTVLGAASGALIGAGNHQAGKGAAIGAVAGLVLGSVADVAANKVESKPTVTQSAAVQTVAPAMQPAAGTMPELRNEVTSKPGPTSPYTWTSRPQIADAPRVPDAPTF